MAVSWFRQKDIHRWTWISNDDHTQKEIYHILGNRGGCRAITNCRVRRGLDVSRLRDEDMAKAFAEKVTGFNWSDN